MTDAERIAALEARLAAAEGRIAQLEGRPLPPVFFSPALPAQPPSIAPFPLPSPNICQADARAGVA